ncbi:glycosyltransferase family protein [Clostridium sp. UBA4548]|uniref:glycosyltransferase family protein n=1 Tax=Clostridium sp. UBA4548 TaxID=1946361 RepID=UPI0025C5C105|nr:glycosyltransferase family protein [Clostridium sp. UBA4548]
MKVVCIIQARTGSSRLPGKVLKQICGKSVLEHDIDRLKNVKNINEIVIATTSKKQDDPIVEEANRLGIKYFRGSEDDVLSRYYFAAKENDADIVVRVTSDCPLIDHCVTENIIQFFIDRADEYDYVSNTIDRTFPRGLDTEVFSYKALEKSFLNAQNSREREHVTPYIWGNPSEFKIFQYKNDKSYSDYRWTLDTQEDYELITFIYERLYEINPDFNMNDILCLYEKYSELQYFNSHIQQKQF